jgi:hypothetical protein
LQSRARRGAVYLRAVKAMRSGVPVTDISEFDTGDFPPEDYGRVLRMVDSANKAIKSLHDFLRNFDTSLFYREHFRPRDRVLEDFAYELYQAIYDNLVNVEEVLCDGWEGALVDTGVAEYFMAVEYGKDGVPRITLFPAEACNKIVRESEEEEGEEGESQQ